MNTSYRNIIILCGISVFIELLVILVTTNIFHSFVDMWCYKVYFETIVVPFLSGMKLPYIDYFWEYPILMTIPVFISIIPVVVLSNPYWFFITFPILMTFCNLVTTACVYFITMKIYQNKKRAMIAGILYATSITAAYITITNFDAMPTMLMMIGIAYTVYGKRDMGYLAYILGFFTKIFTVAVLPLLVLYNAKTTGLKQEVMMAIRIGLVPFLVLFVPVFLLNPISVVDTYIIKNAASKEIFVSSFVYTVYAWIHFVAGIPVSEGVIAGIMTAVLIGVFLGVTYAMYKQKRQNSVFLLEATLVILVSIIALSKYHSPEYMIWIMPILCILLAGNVMEMAVYYLLQIVWYIKFPLTFWTIWTNGYYTNKFPTGGWQLALFLFTVEYLILFWLVWKTSVSKWNLKEIFKRNGEQT